MTMIVQRPDWWIDPEQLSPNSLRRAIQETLALVMTDDQMSTSK